MPKLPTKYAWLNNEPGPKMIKEALNLYGTTEVPGNNSNPTILAWSQETGLQGQYPDDSVAWCGLFMSVVAKRAGKQFPANPLWARNWKNFGTPTPVAMLGDVLVFSRQGGGGHVALYVGDDATHYHILGGNQGDTVNITRRAKSTLLNIRRPIYNNQPDNVRRIQMEASGPVSTNEQ